MDNKKRFYILIIAGLLLFSVLIKGYYVHYTETWERQHDVIGFGAEEGHAAYIEYIFNNKKLPDFDPREKWAFFQPPLHHIVSATVMGLSQALGATEVKSQENIQVFTCIYMILVLLIALWMLYKAGNVNSIKNYKEDNKVISEGVIAMLSVVGLHPIFILMSGSINNDALALLLSMVSLFIAAKWYNEPKFITTVLLALTIGLAMLAKLTGGLVAVPIGILMVIRFLGFDGKLCGGPNCKVKFIDRIAYFMKQYLLKAVTFAIIVFPVGLGFGIRNKIKWDMPLNYIPPVGEVFPDSITTKARIFDIKTTSVYPFLTTRGDAFDEYNIPLAMLKTSLFGEYNYSDVSRWMKPLTLILFISAVVLLVVGLISTVYVMFSKSSQVSLKWKVILFGTWITYFLAYFYFAVSNGNFSAQDFRYSAICIVCQGIFIGLYLDSMKSKKVKIATMCIAIIFAASSFMTYFLLGFKS